MNVYVIHTVDQYLYTRRCGTNEFGTSMYPFNITTLISKGAS